MMAASDDSNSPEGVLLASPAPGTVQAFVRSILAAAESRFGGERDVRVNDLRHKVSSLTSATVGLFGVWRERHANGPGSFV
jgi:hypothetical protein